MKRVNHGTEGEWLLDGRLDTTTAPEAEEIFLQTAERFEKVTLHFAALDDVSSAGLRVIRRLHMTMRKKGGRLVPKNVSKMVMEVFEITGFAGVLEFE